MPQDSENSTKMSGNDRCELIVDLIVDIVRFNNMLLGNLSFLGTSGEMRSWERTERFPLPRLHELNCKCLKGSLGMSSCGQYL